MFSKYSSSCPLVLLQIGSTFFALFSSTNPYQPYAMEPTPEELQRRTERAARFGNVSDATEVKKEPAKSRSRSRDRGNDRR